MSINDQAVHRGDGAKMADAVRDYSARDARPQTLPPRPTPITNTIESIGHQLAVAHKLYAELEIRLGSVICPPLPSDPKKEGRREPTCETDEKLLEIETSMNALIGNIEHLTTRIRV